MAVMTYFWTLNLQMTVPLKDNFPLDTKVFPLEDFYACLIVHPIRNDYKNLKKCVFSLNS